MLIRLVRRVLTGMAIAILVLACLLVYGCVFGGPTVRITSVAGKAHVDTQFLGEYYLGLTKVVVENSAGATVLDVESPSAAIESVFDLVAGTNSLTALGSTDLRPLVPKSADVFVLEGSHRYKIRVCGNNGMGRIGCTNSRFSL